MARQSKADRKMRAGFAVAAKPRNSKKIVLFSDGTGNSSAKAEKTNVWRMFMALDQTDAQQIAAYDNGVGTSSNKYFAAITGAFGWGLKRNVLDLYKFVCRNYQPGDQIYGFGFSRGSFTIRVLTGLIVREGLVTFRSEEELRRNVAAAYRNYRSKSFPTWSPIVGILRYLRNWGLRLKDWVKGYRTYKQIQADAKANGRTNVRIRFLGLWDTVEAYGMPIAELKRGIDWVLWPMMFGDMKLSPQVDRACHALSLDDERTSFHPLIWDEEAEAKAVAAKTVPPGRITQVWFAGMHSNVGGGYPEDQLSLVSLEWMMNEAIANGLALEPACLRQVDEAKSPYARIYDSRSGLAAYFRYSPRRIPIWKVKNNEIKPIVHWSVVLRMANGSDGFAPISLPPNFWVLAPDGKLLPMQGFNQTLRLDTTKSASASAGSSLRTKSKIEQTKDEVVAAIKRLERPDQEVVSLVWDTVWWRRVLYFLTVAFTAFLATFPWVGAFLVQELYRLLERVPILGPLLAAHWQSTAEQSNATTYGFVETTLAAVSGFIPSYLSPWIESLKISTTEMAIIIIAIALCLFGSTLLQSRIHDRARLAWHDGVGRSNYREWLLESQRGWRHGMLLGLILSIALFGVAYWRGWSFATKAQLGILAACFSLVLLWRLAEKAKLRRERAQPSPTMPLHSTFALKLARLLRKNNALTAAFRFVFKGAVPVAFALGLLVFGLLIVNRALFDAVSATGYFCKLTEDVQEPITFATEEMCQDTGVTAVKGQRYRVTLKIAPPSTTPPKTVEESRIAEERASEYDWFDKTIRTDPSGFAAFSFRHYSATLMKRWWGQNWFKPIIRVGEVGNDEYPLNPIPPIEPYVYCTQPQFYGGLGVTATPTGLDKNNPQWLACKSCARQETETSADDIPAKIADRAGKNLSICSPTPREHREFISEFTARTSGRVFIYVNDAVLMLPGRSKQFYLNNSGSAIVTVTPLGLSGAMQ